MTQAPANPTLPPELIPSPRVVPPNPVDGLDTNGDRANIALVRMAERARKVRGLSDPFQSLDTAEIVASLGDDAVLQEFSKSFRSMQRMRDVPTRGQQAVLDIQAMQDREARKEPALHFARGVIASLAKRVQEFGVAAWEVGATLDQFSGKNDLFKRVFGVDMSETMSQMAEDYRDRILSGESDDLGTTLQQLNVQANRNEWSNTFGSLLFDAMPSLGAVMRGTNYARRTFNGVMAVYGTYAAGHGIEKYRREKILNGQAPSAAEAMLVGLGYGASEIAIENLDKIIPWQAISTSAAAKIGEMILRRKPGPAARFLANASGMTFTEGLEEAFTGEFQELIDLALVDGKYDRDWSDRMGDFGLGAAGSALVVAGGSASPSFRAAMMEEPTPLTLAGQDQQLADRAREWLASEPGRSSAIGQAFAKIAADAKQATSTSAADSRTVAPEPAQRVPMSGEDAIAEYTAALRYAEVDFEPRLIPEEARTPAQKKLIDQWAKRGITVIPIAPDAANPLPAFALSQPGTVLVEMSDSPKVNAALADIALIAHETFHTLRATRPDIYAQFVEAAAGPIMAAARQYADVAAGQGLAADLHLDDPDRLIDEGGAMLFQQAIERTGLPSLLAGNELGVIRAATDFVRRTATRMGLRGPAVKAVFDAMKAIESVESYRPVQPAQDVIDGVKAPRFAVRPKGEMSPDPRKQLRMYGAALAKTITDLDTDFARLRADTAAFATHFGTTSLPLGARIQQAETPAQLRDALKQAFTESTITRAEHLARLGAEKAAAAQAKMRTQFEQRIEAIESFAKTQAAQRKNLQQQAAKAVQTILPPEHRGSFVKSIAGATTPKQVTKVTHRAIDKLNKVNHKEAVESSASAMKKANEEQPPGYQGLLLSYGVASTKDLRGLTTGALDQLTQEIGVLVDVASAEATTKKVAEAAALDLSAETMASEASTVRRGANRRMRKWVELDQDVRTKRAKGLMQQARDMAVGGHLKPQWAAELVFGQGSEGMKRLYFDPDIGNDRRYGSVQSDHDWLEAAMRRAGMDPGTREAAAASEFLAGVLGGVVKVNPIEHEVTMLDGRILRLTSGDRMDLLGMFRDPDTHALISAGTPIRLENSNAQYVLAPEDVAAIEASAFPWERAVVDAMFQRYNGAMASATREWSKKRRGIDITRPDYWPRRREVDPGPAVADWTEREMQRMGLLQDRTHGTQKPIIVVDAFRKYINHSWQVASLVHLEEPIANARAILADPRVAKALDENPRFNARKYFDDFLNRLAGEGLGAPTLVGDAFMSRLTRSFRNNAIRGLLGVNPTVLLYQPAGLLNAGTMMNSGDLTVALARGSYFNTGLNEIIAELDPWLRHRMHSSGVGFFSENDTGQQQLLGFKGERLMSPFVAMENGIIRTIFEGYRIQLAREKPNLSEQERNVEAAALTNRNVKETQPTFDLMHQSGIAREVTVHPTVGLLTMFTSQFNTNLQIYARDLIRFVRDPNLRNGTKLGQSVLLVGVGNAMWVVMVKSLMSWIVKLLGGENEDDRSLVQKFLGEFVASNLSMVYGGSGISMMAERMFGRKIPPGSGAPVLDISIDTVQGLVKAGDQVFRAASNTVFNTKFETDSGKFWNGIEDAGVGIATLKGVPVAAPYRLVKRVVAPPRKKQSSGRRSARRALKAY